MSMPTFLPCFGQPCRRCVFRCPDPNTAIPSAKHNHQGTTRGSSSEVGDEDFGVDGSSPRPLPFITYRGPPTAKNNENPKIYCNSIMTEAGEDKKARLAAGPFKKGHSEVGRSGQPDAMSAEAFQPRGSHHALKDAQANVSTAESAAGLHGRDNSGHVHQFLHQNSPVKCQADHDLTFMPSSISNRVKLPVHQVQAPRHPRSLIHQTPAWDHFVDPLEYTPRSRLSNPRQNNNVSEEPPRTHQSFDGVQEEKDLPDLPFEHHHLPFPLNLEYRKTPPLTWNTCLNEVLGHGSVDQDMVGRVKGRVKNSTAKNGDGENERFHMSAIAAGLVPNFSYRVVGSPFYDRVITAQSPPPAMTNGILPDSPGSDDTEPDRHTSTATNHSLDFNFDLPNTPSTTSCPLRSPTSSTSEYLYCAPTSPCTSTTRCRLDTFLTEILTPSELDLCETVLHPPLNSPPRLEPLQTRLTLSLHRALLHLQDRVLNLEDSLLPQLGTALEKKTYTIDVLSVEVQSLDDQIRELKLALDFGNKILVGSWVREYEMWRTMLCIGERRRKKEWWRWWNVRKVAEGNLSPDERGEVGMKGAAMKLRNGEIEALIGMAKQNVEILREDVDDMVEKVEKCRREHTPYPVVERVEGSWRDV
ncbi:hypothetical protein DE146DRAFT_645515 [Phaeosphaeria sp. MPI-PUGE-AT-0046c]|nr:hypothetical protein DE146DRAFT_645515 [Phaeosphaeria sp. MPI-PUGE-AT-0046c]